MNSFIKKFIENNINIIESNEWEHVFLNWYNLAEEIWPDNKEFDEFLTILRNVGIYPDTGARESVLYNEIKQLFQNWMKDIRFEATRYIGIESISDDLHSHLGYSYSELKDIINKVANTLNLKYSDDYYYGGGYTW